MGTNGVPPRRSRNGLGTCLCTLHPPGVPSHRKSGLPTSSDEKGRINTHEVCKLFPNYKSKAMPVWVHFGGSRELQVEWMIRQEEPTSTSLINHQTETHNINESNINQDRSNGESELRSFQVYTIKRVNCQTGQKFIKIWTHIFIQ